MDKFQPATVPVQVIRIPGDFAQWIGDGSIPIRWFAELQPHGPAAEAGPENDRPKKPKPPKGAAAPPAAGSPFPNPARGRLRRAAPPPPPPPTR